jgi:hypothetical protein
MKLFLSLLLFFIFFNCSGQIDSIIVNEKPHKFLVSDDYFILVAEKDFPKKMNWRQAMIECRKLGEGWHLPSLGELSYLQKNDSAHIFSKEFYWTNSALLFLRGSINIKNGKEYFSSKNNLYRVRAIWHADSLDNKKKIDKK